MNPLQQPQLLEKLQHHKTNVRIVFKQFQQNSQDHLFMKQFGLPSSFENFTGREESLALLETQATQNTMISQLKKTDTGIASIGKTQLAVMLAYKKLKQFQNTHRQGGYRYVIWLIAGTGECSDDDSDKD